MILEGKKVHTDLWVDKMKVSGMFVKMWEHNPMDKPQEHISDKASESPALIK